MKRLLETFNALKSRRGFEPAALAALTVFVLITAGWFPLLFGGSAQGGDLSLNRRFEIFDKYIQDHPNSYILTAITPDELLKRQISLAERKYKTLVADFVPGGAAKETAASGAYFKLTVENGDAIWLWHIEESWTGDWENTLELFMDAKTGDLYSFTYTGALINQSDPGPEPEEVRGFDYAVTSLQRIVEYKHLEDSARPPLAAFLAGGQEVYYSVHAQYRHGESAQISISAVPPQDTEE